MTWYIVFPEFFYYQETLTTGVKAQTAFPGDVVSISGIVKVVTLNEEVILSAYDVMGLKLIPQKGGRRRGMRGDRNAKSMFQLYVEANNISNDKSNRGMKVLDRSRLRPLVPTESIECRHRLGQLVRRTILVFGR